VLSTGLLVIHDTSGGGQDDETELTGWEKTDNPLLKLVEADVVAWHDDTGLVETAVKLDNNLSGSVVINLLEFTNVTYFIQSASNSFALSIPVFLHTVLLHDGQELDNDLGGRSDEDLSLASLLGIVDGVQAVVKDGSLDHFVGI
jgi:hypothetical protein